MTTVREDIIAASIGTSSSQTSGKEDVAQWRGGTIIVDGDSNSTDIDVVIQANSNPNESTLGFSDNETSLDITQRVNNRREFILPNLTATESIQVKINNNNSTNSTSIDVDLILHSRFRM